MHRPGTRLYSTDGINATCGEISVPRVAAERRLRRHDARYSSFCSRRASAAALSWQPLVRFFPLLRSTRHFPLPAPSHLISTCRHGVVAALLTWSAPSRPLSETNQNISQRASQPVLSLHAVEQKVYLLAITASIYKY
jgi:hypothetical protein